MIINRLPPGTAYAVRQKQPQVPGYGRCRRGHFPEPSARRVDVKATVLGSRFDGYLASKQTPEQGCVFRPIFPGGIRLIHVTLQGKINDFCRT